MFTEKAKDINDRVVEAINFILSSNESLSKSELAKEFGYKPAYFSGILNKRLMADSEDMFLLSERYSISPHWLLTGEGPMLFEENIDSVETQDIPLVKISASGSVTDIFDLSFTSQTGCLRVSNHLQVNAAVYVNDDSMAPFLKSGDIVIIKDVTPSMDNILWGQPYYILYQVGEEVFFVVRYVQKSEVPEHIRIVSHNSSVAPKDIPISSILGLAIVKAVFEYRII